MSICANPIPTSNSRGAILGYENLLTASTTSEAEKALIPNTWERYRPAAGALTVKFQMSSAADVNFIGIAAHNFKNETLLISTAATIGGALTDVESISPSDNKAIMLNFDTRNIQEVAITGTLAAVSELGVFYAGNSLQMPRNIYGGHAPMALADRTEYQSPQSESGQFLGRTITRKGGATSYAWQFLKPDFVRGDYDLFVESAKTKPFFIKWRPDLFSNETSFGFTDANGVSSSNMGGGSQLMTSSFDMSAHDDV